MKNEDVAKVALAAGAGVVGAVVVVVGAPWVVMAPLGIGLGAYIGHLFSKKDDKQAKGTKTRTPNDSENP